MLEGSRRRKRRVLVYSVGMSDDFTVYMDMMWCVEGCFIIGKVNILYIYALVNKNNY